MPNAHPAPTRLDTLLAQMGEKDVIAKGTLYQIYRFPPSVPGLENYVLRAPKRQKLTDLISETSSLVPVKSLLAGVAVGQPLFMLSDREDVTIMRKQPGVSITQLQQNAEPVYAGMTYPKTRASTTVMNQLLALAASTGSNPFTPLFQQAYQLVHAGFDADLSAGNILYDYKTNSLSLVDQLQYPEKHNGHSTPIKTKLGWFAIKLSKDLLDESESPLGEAKTKNDAAHSSVTNLITQAKREVDRHPPKRNVIRFENTRDVQGLSLKRPPGDLVAALDDMHARTR